MPQVIHTNLKSILLNLFLAKVTAPSVIYMGLRVDIPNATDKLSTAVDIVGGGYARALIDPTVLAVTTSGTDALLVVPRVTFPSFTGVPTINGATHWFLCSVLSGYVGDLYASGPLNPAVATCLPALPVTPGDSGVSVVVGAQAVFSVGDYLNFGTKCGNNQETLKIASFTTAVVSGNVIIRMASRFLYAHAATETVVRDGCTRTYSAGYTETVTATLQVTQG